MATDLLVLHPEESWREVARDPRYQVSNLGNVFGPKGPLKPVLHHSGYLVVTIRRPGRNDGNAVFIHRLVTESFLGLCPADLEVRHLDGVKTNNRLENLCYGTSWENAQDRVRHHAAALMGAA